MIKSVLNWSGGKDSALALYHVLKQNEYHVDRLLTNVNSTYQRISMHGVRTALLEMQATSIGIPLQQLLIGDQPSMVEYDELMRDCLTTLTKEGVTDAIYGDIFLEDLRIYREARLQEVGMRAYFPLWKKDTTSLVHEFLDLGFKTITVCTKAALLDESFCGRIIDKDFLKELPPNVDPCGENGEFHTFVFDGPIFKKPVPFSMGKKILREYEAPKNAADNCFTIDEPTNMGFWFCDLVPEIL